MRGKKYCLNVVFQFHSFISRTVAQIFLPMRLISFDKFEDKTLEKSHIDLGNNFLTKTATSYF